MRLGVRRVGLGGQAVALEGLAGTALRLVHGPGGDVCLGGRRVGLGGQAVALEGLAGAIKMQKDVSTSHVRACIAWLYLDGLVVFR